MKIKLVLLFIPPLLAACGGGSGSSVPPSVPASQVSGKAADGLIIQGTVRIFDFTGGTVGAQLASATTDTVGRYSISMQVESRPILVEVSGGYYIEERSALQVPLEAGQVLTALTNFKMGENVTISATAYTHMAAGLARRLIETGATVSTAITEANNRVTQWLGVPILSTLPVDITIAASATANVTPEHQYGFLSGAISSWTYDNIPSGVGHTKPYRSIDFIQKMYADVRADGLLDGVGAGAAPLSFGNRALGPRVYRTEIGVHILTMAGDARNRTSLTATQLLPFATSYASNTDTMFDNVPTEPISSPVVTITSPAANAWIRGIVNVTATVQDYAGLSSAILGVDSGDVLTLTTNLNAPTFPLNTASYSEGTHSLSVTAMNIVGLSTTATVGVRIDNTPPTIFITSSTAPSNKNCTISGIVSDAVSGVVGTLKAEWNFPTFGYSGSTDVTLSNNTFTFSIHDPTSYGQPANVGTLTLAVSDAASNVNKTTYTYNMTPSYKGTLPTCSF